MKMTLQRRPSKQALCAQDETRNPQPNTTQTHKPEVEKPRDFGSDKDVFCTIVMMPAMVFLLNAACNKDGCNLLSVPSLPARLSAYVDPVAVVLYLGWLTLQMALYLLVPAPWVEGTKLRDNTRLLYTCNGWHSFVLSLLLFGAGVMLGFPVSMVTDRLFGLITTATATSFLLSMYLYWRAQKAREVERSSAGNTGSTIYDFYMGRELNPRIGHIDLKFFCELRPGLIGWLVLDLCYVVQAVEEGTCTPALVMAVLFHGVYVADALYFEEAVLTTLDITTEGFGFMLAFGDLTWVPFLFSLQTRFLYHHPQTFSTATLITIAIVKGIGYWIFRASNNEKDIFRQNPKDPRFSGAGIVETASGRALLVSGWWGWSRHPNYCGDILMALAWGALNGLRHPLPWFYVLYLVGTLVHRSGRDSRLCKEKYGKDWVQYTAKVPYLIVPYIY